MANGGFSLRHGYQPITSIDGHAHRILEAASHTSERTGKEVERVLAEWVIERESVYAEIVYCAQPIIGRVRGMELGSAFDTEAVSGIKRRWVLRLRDALVKGRKISDWRMQTERPLALLAGETEELACARNVIMAVERWLAVDDHQSMTLADAERVIAETMREYRESIRAIVKRNESHAD